MFKREEDKIWYPGETVIASIGQGYMLATPLQLANATAALASRGKRFQAKLILATEDPINKEKKYKYSTQFDDIEINNQKYWEEVISSMHNVIQGNVTAQNVGRDAP